MIWVTALVFVLGAYWIVSGTGMILWGVFTLVRHAIFGVGDDLPRLDD